MAIELVGQASDGTPYVLVFSFTATPDMVPGTARIDALGIHFFSLRTTEDALDRLVERLPDGNRGSEGADLDATLAASPKAALITVTRWRDSREREKTDVVLAREGEYLHVFMRDPDDPDRFKAQGIDHDELRPLLDRLVA